MNKEELSKVELLMGYYEKNPTIRALISVLGIATFGAVSVADAALMAKIQNIRGDRARTFFDELAKEDVKLTPEVIESEDFLHCYFATVKVVLNTKRMEKISMFACLLKSYTLPELFSDTDKYEEYLQALDGLGNIHIAVLNLIAKEEKGITGARIMQQLVKWDPSKGEQYGTTDDYAISAALEKLDNLGFIMTTHVDGMDRAHKNRNATRNYALTPLGKEFVGFVLRP